jgi:hypothetical protein
VIDAHPLESHNPGEWLRYGAAPERLVSAESTEAPQVTVLIPVHNH